MTITFIFIFAAVAIVICTAIETMRHRNATQLERQQFIPYISTFSTSEYMGRIEKASIEIMEKAEDRTKYQIVLWAGLDGIRINDDGTSEWIRRDESKKKASPQDNTMCCISSATTAFDGTMTMQNSIIQNQMQSLNPQQMQSIQNALLMNAIRPQYMQYHGYCYPYYQPSWYCQQ